MGLLDRVQFRKSGSEPPESLDVTERGELHIVWPGGHEVRVPAMTLRDGCPCAECVEEGTGRKILDSSTIPADITPTELKPVGNYAVQIFWSDGHSTGIYSWQTLREVSGLAR
ncbi:MAG TPA: DUF971 domain-containing protein [Anaeromyxobacteraceae bacterium]|nr:DUF971 domain-containing protein [Anaeromyxobacteraceae bacterium]